MSEFEAKLSKAKQAFASLKNIWESKKIRLKTKLRFFSSNVLTTLLYGCESWKTTKAICHELDTFQNRYLRCILNIFWPNTGVSLSFGAGGHLDLARGQVYAKP